jgi:hypothetical protein
MGLFNFFAEMPWYIPTTLVLVGGIVLYTGMNRLNERLRSGGAIALILGLLLFVTSWSLESDREKVTSLSRQLVKNVEKRDWTALEELLHPKVKVAVFRGREVVVEAIKLAVNRSDLKSTTITSVSAKPQGNAVIMVQIQVYADTAVVGSAVTNWQMEWDKLGGRWQATEITPLGGPSISSDALEGWIQSGK